VDEICDTSLHTTLSPVRSTRLPPRVRLRRRRENKAASRGGRDHARGIFASDSGAAGLGSGRVRSSGRWHQSFEIDRLREIVAGAVTLAVQTWGSPQNAVTRSTGRSGVFWRTRASVRGPTLPGTCARRDHHVVFFLDAGSCSAASPGGGLLGEINPAIAGMLQQARWPAVVFADEDARRSRGAGGGGGRRCS